MIRGEESFIKRVIDADTLSENDYAELAPIEFMINF